MKKKILLAVILLMGYGVIFVVGEIRGKHLGINYAISEAKKADAKVLLGRYMIYRDIVAAIKVGNINYAICSANLEASSYFDDIKSCLANPDCKNLIAKDAQKVAPEVLGLVPLKFDYLKSVNGITRCNKDQKVDVIPAR